MDKINIKNQCMGCMSFYDNKYDVCPVCGYSKETESTELFHIDPGTILMNRYVIGRALGYGGFGVTYIGWDKKLNRKVAIKEYLPSEFATRMIHSKDLILPNDQKQKKQYIDGMKKFVEEGQRLAALGEIDGIVSMYDSFEANNTAYIVMEYLEGETLSDYLIREEKIDEKKAINLMMPVLEALEKVHQKGIIHRDIAPDNIFVIRDEEGKEKVKLIDFGAARFASTSHSKSLTVVIKKGYSAEEQYRSNGEQGVYTDVYSVAAVMYKMVTGIVPPDAFERRTAIETKKKDILDEPGKYNRNLSDSFVTAILNAMNVKREDRTPTIAEFEEELVSFEKVKRRGATIKKIDFMRWPLWAKIAVPSFATIAAAIIAFVIIHHFSSPDTQFELEDGMVRVPNLVGVSKDEVEKILIDSNLQVGTINGRFADGDEVEEVVWQSVAAGTVVNKGDFVDYEINMGRRMKNMPNLVGLYLSLDDEDIFKSLISAVDASDSTLIEISVLEEYLGIEDLKVINNDNLSCGYIVKQNIKYNTEIRGGDVLEITIGKIVEEKIDGNDRLVEMPNLQFAKVEEAESVIKVLCGAEIKKEEKYDDYVEKGRIISSSPSREEKIGDRVVLNVSKGPEPFNLLEHGEIKGLREEDAEEYIKKNRLKCEIEYSSDNDDVEVGYVFDYEVLRVKSDESYGKDIVVRGDTIYIYVRCEEETVDVPNVKGKDYSNAKEQLEKLGFKVEINKVTSDEYKKGIVADYIPSGSQKKGAKIILSVSDGKQKERKATKTKTPVEKTTETPTKETKEAQSSDVVKTQKPTETEKETAKKTKKPSEDPNKNKKTKSAWKYSNSLPSDLQNVCDIQYSYLETKETNSVLSDSSWEKYDEDYEWVNDESAQWSSWSTTRPDSDASITVEGPVVRYRYKDKHTTTSHNSSMSGWTRVDSNTTYGNWSGWSGWTVGSINDDSDTKEIERKTLYRYYCFYCPVCGGREPFQGRSDCGRYTLSLSDGVVGWFTTPYSSSNYRSYTYTGDKKYTESLGDGLRWNFTTSNLNDTSVGTRDGHNSSGAVVIDNGYRYRTRSKTITYTYEKWDDWSSWQDSMVQSSSSRKVESKTFYRWKKNKKRYTYYYEKWSKWSDEEPYDEENVKYRYKVYE